jgi:endonuclease YncB( thermonuclease family)
MNINIQIALMTLAATMGAILLAAYFTLRGRLVLAGVCLLCFFALLRPSVVYGGEACLPIKYADGDTFSFMRNGALVRVRVAGFDAPERAQPFGQAAEARLQLLTRLGATCDCYKADRHGRSVCTVHTRQGVNVATLMLQAGLGCIDERFEAEASAQDREAARAALAQAQAQRVGMWAQRDAQCAFDYRRAQRAQ